MSKMPAKKKSCFQITSVTQAQVAASSVADDTESLDDPDESRTEDMSSSEIFDVSRADLMGACDRSSSEETLNNVGEHQEGQQHQQAPTGPVNGGFSVRSAGSGRVTPHLAGGGVPSIPSSTTTTQPMVNSVPHHVPANVAHVNPVATSSPTSTTTTTCSSRFRVIKLDHGSGEPFRRGRWTCTEFYERDSEGSSMSRTVDSIKHAVVLDHNNVDRDSGLGVTGGFVVLPTSAASAQESNADSGYSVAYHTHPPEPLQQQGYTLASQAGSGASAFQPTGYSTVVPQQHPQQANMQPVAPQNLHPSGLNGAQHGAMLQKSPLMPPGQQYAYSAHAGGQPDYRQQQFAPLQPQGSNTQNLPMASLSAGPPASQGPSPALSPAGPGAQGGEAASAQGLMVQVGSGASSAASATTTTYNSVQNVPATVPSSNSTPPGMLLNHHMPSTGGLAQAQGAHGGALMMGLPVGFRVQAEDGGRKSDILPQPSAGALTGKDGMKPFISDGLPTPTTVSIFGIPITIDGGDEDRNPSTAFYQAFPPSRLRGAKPINDSASGASVVAIDNKIEQAMDLVKSHLMYAVREEVEVLKEQIKELYERNSMLERENAVLKSLANTEQLSQVSNHQVSPAGSMSPPQQQILHHPSATTINNNNSPNASLAQHDGGQQTAAPHQHQPNVTSA